MVARKFRVGLRTAGLLALLIAVAVAQSGCGGSSKKLQTVRFQKPTEAGANPFTAAADVRGKTEIPLQQVGAGPFGGTGSDLVCDRELLIRSLRARPDRLRAWAGVAGIEPTYDAVARYIRALRPVTLTYDTRVTNHSFVDGAAPGYQAILQAGTAVLVDAYGVPRARCRCGNPLLPPIYVAEASCVSCPAHYTPPPPCEPYSKCYRTYPHPPAVSTTATSPPPARTYTTPPAQTQPPPQTTTTTAAPSESPSASFSPSSGRQGDTFVLSASGFRPNATLDVTLTRPDGQVEHYSISTGSDGSGQYTFGNTQNVVTGTYNAVVRNPGTGAEAQASVDVAPAGQSGGGQP